MKEIQISIVTDCGVYQKIKVDLESIYKASGKNVSQPSLPPLIYDTGLKLKNGTSIKLCIFKENNDYYWHLKKIRKLSQVLDPKSSEKILINGELCVAKVASGSWNHRILIDVYSDNAEKNKFYLYSVSKCKQSETPREVVDVEIMRRALEQFAHTNNLSKYLERLGFPKFKQTDLNVFNLSIDNTQSDFWAHSYMINGNQGTLSKNHTLKKPVRFEEIKYCIEGLLFLLAAGYSHEDIKPDNIVKNNYGYFLIDFGFGRRKSFQELHCKDSLMMPVTDVRGTGYYNPPKLLVNSYTPVNKSKKDIYGVCLSFLNQYIEIEKDKQIVTNQQLYTWLTYNADVIRNKVFLGIARDYPSDPQMKKALATMLDICYNEWAMKKQKSSLLICNLASAFEIDDENLISLAINKSGGSLELRNAAFHEYLKQLFNKLLNQKNDLNRTQQVATQLLKAELVRASPNKDNLITLVNSGASLTAFTSIAPINIGQRIMEIAYERQDLDLYSLVKDKVNVVDVLKLFVNHQQNAAAWFLWFELGQNPVNDQTVENLFKTYPINFNLHWFQQENQYINVFAQKAMDYACQTKYEALFLAASSTFNFLLYPQNISSDTATWILHVYLKKFGDQLSSEWVKKFIHTHNSIDFKSPFNEQCSIGERIMQLAIVRKNDDLYNNMRLYMEKKPLKAVLVKDSAFKLENKVPPPQQHKSVPLVLEKKQQLNVAMRSFENNMVTDPGNNTNRESIMEQEQYSLEGKINIQDSDPESYKKIFKNLLNEFKIKVKELIDKGEISSSVLSPQEENICNGGSEAQERLINFEQNDKQATKPNDKSIQPLFKNHIDRLETQVQNLKKQRDKTIEESKNYGKLNFAYDTANKLYTLLKECGSQYFAKKMSYVDFKKCADDAIRDARPVLEEHIDGAAFLNSARFLIKLAHFEFNRKMTFFKFNTDQREESEIIDENMNEAGSPISIGQVVDIV